MNDYDVIVVGGGPVGCFTAQQLALKRIHVAVVEEHDIIGRPQHCAGLVTTRVFDITTCSQRGLVQNKIYGAYIHSPDGTTLTIGGDRLHALVINRPGFDHAIAKSSSTSGADLLTGQKVISAQKEGNDVILTMQQKKRTITVRCRLVIGADGAYSRIRTSFGFSKPREILQGIGAELSNTALDPRFVHIFVGRSIAPGFFAWVIPTNQQGSTARIGLCIGKNHPYPLQRYYTTLLHHPLLQGATIMERFGGTIPLGPLKTTVGDNVMLVGDAAAQVKPTSGGGLYPGLLCSKQCACIAEEAVHRQHYEEKFLRRYHMEWTREIGRELSLGMRFRRIFSHLSDTQFNKYLMKLNTQKTIETINTHGDIDYPSRLALPLLRTSPSLLSLAPTILKRTNQ